MSREKTLIKNTIIYAIGNLGSKILSFFLLPLYTYCLSKSDYGYYDLITTTISLLLPIISFQLNDGMYRYLLSAKSEKEKKEVFTNAFTIIILNLLIFNIIYYLVVNHFYNIKYSNLIILLIDISIISSLLSQAIRGLKYNFQYALSGLINTFAGLILNIFFIIYLKKHVDGLLLANILSNSCVLIYLIFLKIFRYFDINLIRKKLSKKMILFSIPLIPNVVSWWIMNVSDRFLLKHYMGVDANGLYAVANKFPSLLTVLNSLFYLAWQESAITEYNSLDRDKYYSKVFDSLSKFMLSSIIVLLPLTKLMLKVMVANKFREATLYIPFLYMGTVFSLFSWFYGTGYLSSEHTFGAFSSSVFGAGVNIIINIILIPKIGIQAASLSTMLAFLAMWLIRVYQTKKFYSIKIKKKTFSLLMILVSTFIILYYINNIVIDISSVLCASIIFIISNIELIRIGFKYIKSKIVFKY